MNAPDKHLRRWWIAEQSQAIYHAAIDEGKTRAAAGELARVVRENLEAQEISVLPEEEIRYLRLRLDQAREKIYKTSRSMESLREQRQRDPVEVESDRLREERNALLTSLAISLDVPESVAWRIARLDMREIAEGDIVELAAELSA